MATCYERPGPPPERSRLAPGAAARRRSGSGRSLGGPAMGMSKHAGAADLSGGVVSLAGGGRRVCPRPERQSRRSKSNGGQGFQPLTTVGVEGRCRPNPGDQRLGGRGRALAGVRRSA